MMANRSMPPATVTPVLHCPDVAVAADWLVRAFGFAVRLRIGDHRIQLAVGDSGAVVVAKGDAPGPNGAKPPFSLLVRVADADAHARAAEAAGAAITAAPQTLPFGERQYGAVDPAGYAWTFSQSVADVDPADWGGEMVPAQPAAG